MSTHENWLTVADAKTVYCGIASRDEFDLIALPAKDHGSAGRPVLTKTVVHGVTGAGVTVVFQHWYGPSPAERAAEAALARMRGQRDELTLLNPPIPA